MTEMSSPPELSLSPVPRAKLAEQVAEQLLAEIRDKRLERGTRMPSERELMVLLGVGRSTIREAINGLAMLGVLEIRHGQGAFVADPAANGTAPNAIAMALSRGLTTDLFEARRLVEVETARLAAERRTESDVRDLEGIIAEHARLIAEGRPAVDPSVRFHVAVAAAAHNEVLFGFVTSFAELLAERGPTLEKEPGYREWELEQHTSVLRPIVAGDRRAAARAMRAHLDAVVPYHEHLGLP
ncbi:MAG: FadR family transcriptional regulator [Thermoleophilia bacterium]|nr:FadR family transcriptional regulator [Thermoleophilia bacterium]